MLLGTSLSNWDPLQGPLASSRCLKGHWGDPELPWLRGPHQTHPLLSCWGLLPAASPFQEGEGLRGQEKLSLNPGLSRAPRHRDGLGKLRHFPAELGQMLFVFLLAVPRRPAGDGWHCHSRGSALSQPLALSWGGKFGALLHRELHFFPEDLSHRGGRVGREPAGGSSRVRPCSEGALGPPGRRSWFFPSLLGAPAWILSPALDLSPSIVFPAVQSRPKSPKVT